MNQTAAIETEAKGRKETSGTGPFEFFRKYQKLILYTAGLFTLVTFSITGALMGFFDSVFRPAQDYGTIEIAGRIVPLTDEDFIVARKLRQPLPGGAGYPAVVLPPIGGDEDNLLEMYAILRRAAIESGIEVSSAEVDRAIDQVVQQSFASGAGATATQIALRSGHSSLQAYRDVVTEAMRVGTYLRLEALAADTSDAAMTEELLEHRKKIALKVAELDREALQKQLEEEGVADEVLQTWLAELDETDSAQFRDTNHVAIVLAGVLYDQFDPELFSEELTDVPPPGEEQLRLVYERDKETRFRKPAPPEPANPPDPANPQDPPADPYYTFEDVKDRIQRMLAAEEVLREFWTDVQIARTEHLQEAQGIRDQKLNARTTAQVNETAAREASEADPDNAELKENLATAKTALETAETEYEEAEVALEGARADFDMETAFKAAVGDRLGFVVAKVPEPTDADGLKDLPEMGTWTDTWAATSMSSAGDLSSVVQRADHGAFHFMVTGIVVRPLKPFEEIKEEAATEYFRVKADDLAAEKGEAFEAALLRLAKEKIAERVAELEAEKVTELETRVVKWREDTQVKRDEAEQLLKQIADPRLTAYTRRKATLDALEAELADEEGKRAELQEIVDQEIEEKVKEEARKVYGDVLEAAATEAGFTVETLPAYPRQLAESDPRFDYRYGKGVQFLFRDPTVTALEEGESTELLDDATGRALRMAVCTAVEDFTRADLTRRDIVRSRTGSSLRPGFFVEGMGFPEQRIQQAYVQSFSQEALAKRLKWQPSEPQQEAAITPGAPRKPK